MKIAIIDDESIIRHAVATVINNCKNNDWEVVGLCSNGKEALKLLSATHIDVIISDIKMPDMDGIELLRALAYRDDIFVIFLSGYDEFEYAQYAVRYGAVDYILKPMNPGYIISVLEKCYEKIRGNNNDKVQGTLQYEGDSKVIGQAIKFISQNYSKKLSLSVISGRFFLNPQYFSKLFKQETGVNYIEYLKNTRIENAKRIMDANTHLKIYEISLMVGYENPKYFCKLFKELCDITPQEYIKHMKKQ